MKAQVDKLAAELPSIERASELLQQVDWESAGFVATEDGLFGLESEMEVKKVRAEWRSRIRGYVDPSELMGFAARGLFMNRKATDDNSSSSHRNIREMGPLRAWKQFLQVNVLGHLNYL